MTNDLRRRAEAMLAAGPEPLEDLSPEQVRELVRELCTHQNELELQNEQLSRAQQTLVTTHKRNDELRGATAELLRLLSSPNESHELMRLVCVLLRDWTGCEAVGIRLQKGEDFPYFETHGFSDDFVQAESRLCAVDENNELVRDSDGNPVLECMCGNVICGRTDPSRPFFTEFGSFWTNSTTELLTATTEADRRARTRNRCHGEDYESVALVPLRTGGEILGLLQFNDKRRGCFSVEMIAFLEIMAAQFATGLAHREAHEALRVSADCYRTLAENTGDIIARFDRQFRHLYANSACAAVTGLTPEEYIGKTHWELGFPSEQCDHLEQKIDEAFRTGLPVRDEIEYDGKPGLRMFHWLLTPEFGPDGSVSSVLSNVRDITERKEMERRMVEVSETERAQLRGSLHDTVCQHLVAAGLLTDHVREDMGERVEVDVERVDEVRSLIARALEEAHLIGLRMEPLPDAPDALLTALQDLAARIAGLYDTRCRVTSRTRVEIHNRQAGNQLLLIAQEAATNAAKHAEANRIGISLSRRGRAVILRIRDDGKGMPERRGARQGMGIQIMQERAALIGARLTSSQPAEGGTVVECVWRPPAGREA